MTTIVTRAGKGSRLTTVEMDANLNNLNNDKLEVAAAASPTSLSTPILPQSQHWRPPAMPRELA